MVYRKRCKAPLVTKSQEKTQKRRIRQLARGALRERENLDVVMDDKTYFTFTGSEMPANTGFYTGPGGYVPNNVRYRPEGKFPRKPLVWMAISPRGVSKPDVLPSRVNVGGEIYREKCPKEGLLPFLNAKYPREGFIFWPDLAAAHYARETLQFLQDAGVPVVGRDDNPPNVPQLRPSRIFRSLKLAHLAHSRLTWFNWLSLDSFLAHPWLILGSPSTHIWLTLITWLTLCSFLAHYWLTWCYFLAPSSLFANSWRTWLTWFTWLTLLILGSLGSSQPYTEGLLSALAQRRSYQPW